MAKTPSTMLPLGTKAHPFELLDTVSKKKLSLDELKSPVATVIMFICNHCPYVVHISDQLAKTAAQYINKGISFIAISSNDPKSYPQDGPDAMHLHATKNHYPFPYLFDETQEVAKAYHAACTPDFYIFDDQLRCVYRGQFDDSRPGNPIPVTGESIRQALDCILDKQPLNFPQKPSLGCNIKWKESLV